MLQAPMISTPRTLYRRRNLIWSLALSNLKQAHSNTLLGYVWWLLDPILMTIVYTILFSILRKGGGIPYYPAFVMCGLVFWKCFSTTTQQSITVLEKSDGLIKSFSFPKGVLPLSLVVSNSILFVFALVPLLVLCAYYEFGRGLPKIHLGTALGYLPVIFVVQSTLCLGSALLFSCFGAFFKDLSYIMSHILRIVWYLSPGMYALSFLPGFHDYKGFASLDWSKIHSYYALSPLVHILEGYRDVILYGKRPDLIGLTVALGGSLLLLVISLFVFRSQERKFAKVI